MPRKSEQEWAIIENEYIHSPVTYDSLSKKYDINIRAICVRAMKHKWEVKRKADIQKTTKIVVDSQAHAKAKEDFNLLNTVEELIKEKSKAELLALKRYYHLAGDAVSPMDLMKLINKSKDSCSELIKISELLKGNATDRTEFTDGDKDKQARENRLSLLGINN